MYVCFARLQLIKYVRTVGKLLCKLPQLSFSWLTFSKEAKRTNYRTVLMHTEEDMRGALL